MFDNNNIQDEMLAIIIFAAFMNPDINCISIISNYIRGTAGRSYYEMNRVYPSKIIELTLTNAVPLGDQVEAFLEDLTESGLQCLNLSNVPLQSRACRLLGHYMVN